MVGRNEIHDGCGVKLENGCESCLAFGEYDMNLLGTIGEGGNLFNEGVRVRWFV